jgi:predicted ATP-binding protein involved in virulence
MEKIKIPIVDNIENAESVIIIQPYDYISEEYLFQIIHKLEERKIPYQINLMDEEFSLPIKFQSKKAVQVITNIREKLINEYTEKIFSFSSFETLQNNIQFFLFNKPTTSLKIISLELKNIGLFEDATFQFHKKATVLVGLNGTGKTTILRSLGLGLIGSHHDSTPLDSIRSLLDIKQWSQENQKKENGIIKVTCEINSKIIETEIVLSVNEESGKITCSSKGTSNLFNGAFLKVPMIGFGQQRKQFSPTEKKKDFVDVSFPSINDITNLINNNEDDRLHSFVSWIANIKNESQKKGKENKAELIFLAFQIFSEIADEIIQFQELKNIDPLNLWITTKESPSGIPIEYSSQGFQTIMGWIGYIIERMNEAYPSSKDFKSEPAIVIIDEIDSFLHPKWQQNVLKVLMKTFPNMQIIASSHSPIVIDGLDKNQVIALRYNEKYKKIEAKVNLVDIWAWDYEEILLKLFDVYQIPKEYQAAVIEKMEAIRSKPFQTEKDKKELEDYQRLLDRLEESRIYNNEIEQIKKTLKEKEAQLDRLIEKYEKKV